MQTNAIRTGKVVKINSNMISVQFDTFVVQNEVAYVCCGQDKLKAEVIRIKGNVAELQVYENTTGVKVTDRVEFSDELLSVELGPGLLGQIYDGLQNPLPVLAQKSGYFLKRGVYAASLDASRTWEFSPQKKVGDQIIAGEYLGSVKENIFNHYIMAPFSLSGRWKISWIAQRGSYTCKEPIATIISDDNEQKNCFLSQTWPVKFPIQAYNKKLRPEKPLVTKMRIIDSLFPVALGGTYCIPGPFGAGKTVLQQLTSRHAQVDIVIIAACGERAGEVVETLKTFPEIIDPRTQKPLSERTVIICNTSSMPVASRESSVYTAVTIAEYYRQMGLHVLLLADSTSRWAQAMREMSGRLEEIPGEEAFPAYLESRIASFYERAGYVQLHNGKFGSVTIGGTVSPAGGNFEEPVTQATLKVVGAFHGLSRQRSDARRYPAIDPLISWSKYTGVISSDLIKQGHEILAKSNEVSQMMKVIGEEGTSLADYIQYLKGEFFDFVYLQQNAFDSVDESTSQERQQYVFSFISEILKTDFNFEDKAQALHFFQELRQLFKGWNSAQWQTAEFKSIEADMRGRIKVHSTIST